MLSCGVRNLNRWRTPSDQIAFAVHVDPVRRPLRVMKAGRVHILPNLRI